MTDLTQLLETKLDDANPDHWTEDGTPRLSVVQKVTGIAKLTRADIDATGRVRKMVSAPADTPAAIDTEEQVNLKTIALQAARNRVADARANLLAKRKIQADTIMAWMATHPIKTQETVHRENIAREQARKLAIIRGEIDPEIVEPIRPASHLDAILQSGGRGGSCNYGYRRPAGALRGAKLPSQK